MMTLLIARVHIRETLALISFLRGPQIDPPWVSLAFEVASEVLRLAWLKLEVRGKSPKE